MQPVLPTSLDMASARVLGFDATAYINDTNSTLHQRLNIPSNFTYVDTFATPATKSKKNNKGKIAAIVAGIATAGAGVVFGIARAKGKLKLNHAKVLDNFNTFAGKITDTFKKIIKKN